jgi:hypothetical protein
VHVVKACAAAQAQSATATSSGSHIESRSHGAVRPRLGPLVQLRSCLCAASGPGGAWQRWQRVRSHLRGGTASECSTLQICSLRKLTAAESREEHLDDHAGVQCATRKLQNADSSATPSSSWHPQCLQSFTRPWRPCLPCFHRLGKPESMASYEPVDQTQHHASCLQPRRDATLICNDQRLGDHDAQWLRQASTGRC